MVEVPRVDWADEVDAGGVLALARSMPVAPSAAELQSMAALLGDVAAGLDVERALAAVSHDHPRALLAGDLPGPIVVLRWYAPGEVSTVHRHAWTVIAGLHGSGELERWIDESPDGPTLRGTDVVAIGRTLAIGEGELHRQRSGEHGSFELILIGDYSDDRPRVDVLR
jgi:hypothetical protein